MDKHKTAKKTGKPRRIFLNDHAAEIAARLAGDRPDGPIFLNSRGEPWTHNAVGLAMRRLRARAGLGKETVAYGFRHLFVTALLKRGESMALVSKLAGHENIRTTEGYAHLDDMDAEMLAIVNRGGGSGGKPAE
jgi:integrase/recombinase XerC